MKATATLTTPLLSGTIIDDQIALEERAIEDGVAHYNLMAQQATQRGEAASLKPVERMLLHWYLPLVAAIRADQRAIRANERKKVAGNSIWGPPLLSLDAERLAVIAMHETMGVCLREEDNSAPTTRVGYAIGRSVLAEVMTDLMRKSHRQRMAEWRERFAEVPRDDQPPKPKSPLQELDHLFRSLSAARINRFARQTLEDELWSMKVRTQVGVRLLGHLWGCASSDDYEAPFAMAFHWVMRRDGKRKRRAFIEIDEKVIDLIGDGHRLRQAMRPRYLPMIVQPYPWGEVDQEGRSIEGGYARVRTPLVSKVTPAQKAALKAADLSEVFECLNAVVAPGWSINGRTHATVGQIWESGGGLIDVPLRDELPIPPMPAGYDPAAKHGQRWKNVSKEARQRWRDESEPARLRNKDLKTQRRTFGDRFDIATEFAHYEAFYFPHQFDFRSRCYPIPLHLNHQGDDLCRGLLRFAKPVPLTDRGWWWLKVHAANCFGIDDVAFEDRVAWTDRNMDLIRRSATEPLKCDWWTQPEERKAGKRVKSLQFLAACMALTFPEDAAHLPIQLDGTCNGLQHYAAMCRDEKSAAAVNLSPAPAPNSVYIDVAKAVRNLVAIDAEAGNEIARIVVDHIGKPVVKSTVMTSVYGVTMVGAREQVLEKLKKAGLQEDMLYKASMYLSRIVLDGMASVCPAAKAAMDWLSQCARIIVSKPIRRAIEWVTPLGFPVVQPYRKDRTIQIRTSMSTLYLRSPSEKVPVAPGRQKAGFSPNFVHSIDASHMLAAARRCHQEGIDFAAVHDSFWCHASNIDRMATILREEFIALHEVPRLHWLAEQFRSRYPEATFPDHPPLGSFDIRQVAHSPYAFN